MNNREIYRRTFRFAWLRLLLGLLGVAAGIAVTLLGFFLTRGMGEDVNLITTGICLIVGIVLFGLTVRYLGYLLKAGQIAMITRAVTQDELPEDVVAAGKQAVRERFATANVYFALTGAIRAITNQITRGLNALTNMAGGDKNGTVGTIGGLVSLFVQIVLEYVNYCCLGWVFSHPQQSAVKSTCDGAVLYFQNWKTLLKSAGKVMAITLAVFLLVGGAFCLLNASVLEATLPNDASLDSTVLTTEDGTSLSTRDLAYIGAFLVAFLIAGLLHSAFVKPYLLVMVMRGYMDAAKGTPVRVDLYDKLCGMSARFKKLFNQEQSAPRAAETM